MCHTRELAFQISKEYERFSKYMNNVKIAVFFGGMLVQKDEQTLRNNCPHIVVGTPGRILALVRSRVLNLKNIKHFVLDECDKILDQLGENVLSHSPSELCIQVAQNISPIYSTSVNPLGPCALPTLKC